MGKCRFITTEMAGLGSSIIGMRNPMDSWDNSDSIDTDENKFGIKIGKDDLFLAKKLVKSGSEHSKFLRQIQLWANVTVPRYIWSEWDTYHFQTKNSCSTMHTIFKYEITEEMFIMPEDRRSKYLIYQAIAHLNDLRAEYNQTSDPVERNRLRIEAKRCLPESFLQMRTVNVNYAELMNMYHQRKTHRLPEWKEFCKWCESLPYFVEFCIEPFEGGEK